MLSSEIRQSFLDYYTQRGHALLPSASLVPVADPSLLLINSGMAPLKRYFLGQEAPPAPRTCNCQKCVRTIDIDQVGYTNRHNTFFEMLGKWSFGDYFKLQAMQYTLEWMTSKDWLGLDPARLYVTHHERDEESRKLWLSEMGWPESRLFGLGDKDNLWAAGDVGPWGYDTEYFWDFAPDGQPLDKVRFEALCESGRIVEIGNDVFMQFNRDENGVVTDLPMRNVDFGGGLERFTMVLQDVRTVYQTDCMAYLIRGFAEVVVSAGNPAPSDTELFELGAHVFNPYWLAADHIRTATLLLGDGVTPGNVGRNYVLRRLIRRIIAQAYRLGVRQPFIMRLADLVIGNLGAHYIELPQNRDKMIAPWIEKEEQQFFKVMETGYGRLADKLEKCIESRQPVPGEFLFELYDTYGFPFDISKEMCEEQGVEVLEEGFTREMAAQKDRARGAAKFEGDMGEQESHSGDVQFLGYSALAAEVEVLAVEQLADVRKQALLIAPPGAEAVPGLRVTTDRTPFYAASGGQPDDKGLLRINGLEYPCQATAVKGVHIVLGQPALKPGDAVELVVDTERRDALRRPHTTNHLMLKAMKLVLGEHVSQAGSQLDEDEIRFDFSHFQACTSDELRRIEAIVNRWLLEDHPVRWDEMPLIDAKRMGVTAVFDEKYGSTVRVVSVGRGEMNSLDGWVSRELCGGTHMDHTSQAGLFAIVKEESVQSGIRRVHARTGYKALAYVNAARRTADFFGGHFKRPLPIPSTPDPAAMRGLLEKHLKNLIPESTPAIEAARHQIDKLISETLPPSTPELLAMQGLVAAKLTRVESNLDIVYSIYNNQVHEWLGEVSAKVLDTEQEKRELYQENVELRRDKELSGMIEPLKAQVVEQGGLRILAAAVELAERGDVKYLCERFAGGLWADNYVVFIAANVGGKAALCCKASPEAIAAGIKASELIALGAKVCGGGGGGRPEFAEAGGKDGGKCAEAVEAVKAQIVSK